MSTAPDDEMPSSEQAAEPAREQSEMKAFEFLLKIESRLRKEARDDLRARKESRSKESEKRSQIGKDRKTEIASQK
jgi:hypothetical protein